MVCFRKFITHFFYSNKQLSNFIKVAFLLYSISVSASIPFIKPAIQKADEALEIYDYFKAKKLYYSCIKKNEVVANYGLAVIYSRTDNPFTNIDSAFVHIQSASNAIEKIKVKNKKEDALRINYAQLTKILFSKIDSNLFAIAKAKNTIEAYKHYQNYYKIDIQFGKSLLYNVSESAQLIGDILFAEAKEKKNATALKELAENDYKNKHNAASINYWLRNEIALSLPKLTLELEFTETAAQRNVQTYLEFQKKHVNSEYDAAIDDSVFVLSTKHKTEIEYYNFIKQNPKNRNVSKTWQLIYNSASNDNSQNFFKHFLEKYPEYPYRENVAKEYKLSQSVFYKIKRSKLYGFCDDAGNELIKPQYDFVDDFSEGYCAASIAGKLGYLNRAGQIVIAFVYDEAEKFNSGVAVVKKENNYHVINKKNEILFTSTNEIGDFADSVAVIKVNEKYGYINTLGKVVIEPVYDNAYDFKFGYAIVEKDGKSLVINKQTAITKGDDWIDRFTSTIFKIQYDDEKIMLSNLRDVIIVNNLEYLDVLNNELAFFYKNDKMGYIDSLGTIAIEPIFDVVDENKIANRFTDNYAIVTLKGKNILINKAGKNVLTQNYQSIRKPSDGLIAVKKKNKWGYIDLNNDVKIKLQYQEATDFIDGLAIVKLKNKNLLIDKKGNVKLKLKKQNLNFLGGGLIVQEKNEKRSLLDTNLGILIEELDEIKQINSDLYSITKQSKMAYYKPSTNNYIWKEEGF